MPISGYLIFIGMPFTRVSPGIPLIMDHRMADSKNYSPKMQSAFSSGRDHSKRSINREKNKGKTGGEKSPTGYPPIPVIIPTIC
jgi:hypothetical protein